MASSTSWCVGAPGVFSPRRPSPCPAGASLVAALCCVWLSLLGSAMTAQAQTAEQVLVANDGQAHSGWGNAIVAQPFRTGMHAGGYVLASIGLRLESADTDILVRVTPRSGNNPDESDASKIITLTTPATITGGNILNTFTAPAGATLEPNTNYFVVVTNTNINGRPGGVIQRRNRTRRTPALPITGASEIVGGGRL